MDRRKFIGTTMASGASVLAAASIPNIAYAKDAAPISGLKTTITTRVSIAKDIGPVDLWMPVFQKSNWQQPMSRDWTGQAALSNTPDNSGAQMLRIALDERRSQFTLTESIATWDRQPQLRTAQMSPDERAYWTAEEGSESDKAAIKAMADEITLGTETDFEKARAIYDWVVINSWRDSSVKACGKRQVVRMLREGHFGGKCADINGVAVCLSRAAGLPAREMFGIRHSASLISASMGANSDDISGAQHCRAEVFLEDVGQKTGQWFAIDPADVRKVIKQEKQTLESPKIAALQERLFGQAEGNWASYNAQTGLKLNQSHTSEFDFLMYPTAFNSEGQLASDALSYEITTRTV